MLRTNRLRGFLWSAVIGLALPVIASAQTATPPAPDYLNASVSAYTVTLNWAAVSTATHYNVQRATYPSADYSTYACSTSGAANTSCTDTSVTSGASYTYRVEACLEGNGCSGAWNSQWAYSSAVTIGSSGSTCTGFTLTTDKTSYTVGEDVSYTWSCGSGSPTYVQIQLVKPDSSVTVYNTYSGSGQSSMSLGFNTSNLAVGSYTLQACFTSACSTAAASASFSMAASGSGGTYVPPTTVTAVQSGNSIVVSWPVPSPVPPMYKVERSANGGAYAVLANSLTALTHTDSSSLASGSTYAYRVYSCGSSSVCSTAGTASNTITYAYTSGGTGSGSIPAAPGSLTATASASTVNLAWPVVSNATHYNLYRSSQSVSDTWVSVCSTTSSAIVSCSDSSVPAGTYQYRIEACASGYGCSGAINSQWAYSGSVSVSSTASGTAPAAPGMPAGPATLLVGQSGSYTSALYGSTGDQLQAIFDWGDGTYYGYSNTMSVSSSSTGTVSSAVPHSFASAGTYYVRAKAKSTAGLESGWSGTLAVAVSGSTQSVPAAPSNLRLESVAGSSVYLKWSDNATNEDKFNVERKLTATSDWSSPLVVQLQGANITSYTDATASQGAAYDYRVQACLSGTGCSAYASLSGVTVGTRSEQEPQPVTVKMRNGMIVPGGMVTFVRDNTAVTAAFSTNSSMVVYLPPGTYEMLPSFPGVASSEVQLTGSGVAGRQLMVNTSSGGTVEVYLPVRYMAQVLVRNQTDEPLAGARVEAGKTDTTAYVSSDTDGSGVAWLQLPPGTYQTLVSKPGYLARTVSIEVKNTNVEIMVTLEPMAVAVTGKVLSGTQGVSGAAVRAVDESGQIIVVVNTNDSGEYRIALKAGTWHLYAVADGYEPGDGGEIKLTGAATRDIALGVIRKLILSSANVVPTVSVTVTAAELGVTVGLPANTLGSGGSASVTIRESSYSVATGAAAPLPASVREVTASSAGIAVTQLGNAATLEFGYTESDLTLLGVGVDKANHLKLAFWDEGRHDWGVLSSVVDTSSRKVRAATTHFTLFAIVLPFLASPAQAQTPTPALEPAPETPAGEQPLDDRAAQFARLVAEGTKVYVSSPESLAQAVGKIRDSALEQNTLASIVRKVVPQGTVSGVETAVTSFVAYGTVSTVHLGAGERAGVVGSFQSAYGRLPQSEYDWQEILKIANGRWPGTLLPERETAMSQTFQRVYLRSPNQKQANDNAALSIMAYGLRSAKRNLGSEAAAIASFRSIFGRAPSSSSDWDAVRAIAYSGAKR